MSEDNKAVIRRLVAEVLNASASSTAPLRVPAWLFADCAACSVAR